MATSTPGALTTEVNADQAQVSALALEDMRIIGRAEQQWAPLRRKYNLFVHRLGLNTAASLESLPFPHQTLSNAQAMDITPYNNDATYDQFAYVDEPFLSWDFSLLKQDSRLLGSVNRNFAGFGREIFTDTGVYALRMDAVGLAQEPGHMISRSGRSSKAADAGMTLDQRAVMLATAVSVDFDYFSRHSGHGGGGGFMPLWFPGMGGGAAEAGAGAEAGAAGAEAGAAGAEGGVLEGAAGGAGNVARGATGAGEGMAGAGTIAGYEAMQRGAGREGDDASPQTGQDPYQAPLDQGQQQPEESEDVWGSNKDDPWGGNGGGGSGGGDDGGGGGGDSGGGGGWGDFFDI